MSGSGTGLGSSSRRERGANPGICERGLEVSQEGLVGADDRRLPDSSGMTPDGGGRPGAFGRRRLRMPSASPTCPRLQRARPEHATVLCIGAVVSARLLDLVRLVEPGPGVWQSPRSQSEPVRRNATRRHSASGQAAVLGRCVLWHFPRSEALSALKAGDHVMRRKPLCRGFRHCTGTAGVAEQSA